MNFFENLVKNSHSSMDAPILGPGELEASHSFNILHSLQAAATMFAF